MVAAALARLGARRGRRAIFAGGSSGGAVAVEHGRGKNIVVVLTDTGNGYPFISHQFTNVAANVARVSQLAPQGPPKSGRARSS